MAKKKTSQTKKAKAKTGSASRSPIASWGGHKFKVTSTLINSFTDLAVSGSVKTKEKEKGGGVYNAVDKREPVEITMTVPLYAATGCDVKSEAKLYVTQATNGKSGYFYMNGKKLFKCKFLLTNASVKDIVITRSGKWVSCEVALSFSETGTGGKDVSGSSKSNSTSSGGSSGGSGGGGGGYAKASVRSTATTTTKKLTAPQVATIAGALVTTSVVKKVIPTMKEKVMTLIKSGKAATRNTSKLKSSVKRYSNGVIRG